ncbi:MAG: transketolase family protein [Bacillota bacterium]
MAKMATRDAYGKALAQLGEKYPDLVVLDADLSKSTKTAIFQEKYPQRFFNMGIAEQNLIGTAAGLALAGKIPVASTFAVFATGRTYDQIRSSVAYPRLNVKIIATHGGITVGEDGASHQSLEDVALMRVLPNMTVIVPADGVETTKAVEAAIASKGPFYIRLGRLAVPDIYQDDYDFVLGKASILKIGAHATVIASGIMVAEAMEAGRVLAAEGLEIGVINMSTIKPLDKEAVVEAARRTGAVVTAEEHSVIGGLGGAVAEVLGEEYPVPLERIGMRDQFGESGSPEELLEKYGLTARGIVAAVKKAINRKV